MGDDVRSVGSELFAFRKRAGMSQFQLAVCMGWQGTAPVIAIEKGKRHPRSETIEALGDCLGLEPADIHYLQGVAGYISDTRLPRKDRIVRVLEKAAQEIVDLPYPAYISDYQFRCWLANPAATLYTRFSVEMLQELARKGVTIFDLTFDTRLPTLAPPPGMKTNIADIQRDLIFRFKGINLYRRHERFYKAYPECIRARLQPGDAEHFISLWNDDSNSLSYTTTLNTIVRIDIQDFSVEFELFTTPVVQLGSLFFCTNYKPRLGYFDEATYNKLLAKHIPYSAGCVKVWELTEFGGMGV